MSNEETTLQTEIQLALAHESVRIWRNFVGTAWQGKVSKYKNSIVMSHARVLTCGLAVGSSDLIGFVRKKITPEMVGHYVAIFTAIEVKTPTGVATVEQQKFIKMVKDNGGIAGFARSIDEAKALIKNAN